MAPQSPQSPIPADPTQLLEHFLAQIQSLQQAVAAGSTPGSTLQGQFLALQQLAQQGVLQLTPEPARPPAGASAAGESVAGESVAGDSIVAYQTEISRTLRLLGMDVTFLQAARQPQTRLQRQRQMGDRLTRLQRHSEGMLTVLSRTP